jgi:mRNA interferase HigB
LIVVRIIAKTRLMQLARPWPEARQSVCDWHDLAEAARWPTPNSILASDPTASILANRRVVFNVLGNRFRLVVKVDYVEQKLFIRFFGTHKQYDGINAEEI